MVVTIEQLTAKERRLLALFYGSETYEALRHLVDLERMELAKENLDQLDILMVRYLSGQAMGLRKLIETLIINYKSGDTAEKRKKQV